MIWFDEVVCWPSTDDERRFSNPEVRAAFDRIWNDYLDRLCQPMVPVPEPFVRAELPQDVASPWIDLVALEQELSQPSGFPRFYLNRIADEVRED